MEEPKVFEVCWWFMQKNAKCKMENERVWGFLVCGCCELLWLVAGNGEEMLSSQAQFIVCLTGFFQRCQGGFFREWSWLCYVGFCVCYDRKCWFCSPAVWMLLAGFWKMQVRGVLVEWGLLCVGCYCYSMTEKCHLCCWSYDSFLNAKARWCFQKWVR